jgi:hypothetical protein
MLLGDFFFGLGLLAESRDYCGGSRSPSTSLLPEGEGIRSSRDPETHSTWLRAGMNSGWYLSSLHSLIVLSWDVRFSPTLRFAPGVIE